MIFQVTWDQNKYTEINWKHYMYNNRADIPNISLVEMGGSCFVIKQHSLN